PTRARAAHSGLTRARRALARAATDQAKPRGHSRTSDRVPEPGFGAQPTALREPHPTAIAEEARRPQRRRSAGASARADALRPARGTIRQRSTCAALRRTEAAGGDRAGLRRRAAG